MAIYKIFPEKDATVYSQYPVKNTGLDEILEISLYDNSILSRGEVSRALIKFPTSEILDVFSDLASGSNYSASLKLFLANASEIPLEYKIYANPLSGSWEMGTGRESNLPTSSNGVSWLNRNNNITTDAWLTTSFTPNVTSSFETYAPGGGDWYTGSLQSSQSFSYQTSQDINIDVTNSITGIINGTIVNEGFILRHDPDLEFNTTSSIILKYFSGDTHTIYPPLLEIKWDDFLYNTGSSDVISTSLMVVNFPIQESYAQDSVQKFRINVREQFPARSFQASSVYLSNKLLPSNSYWAIKDVDTEEYIVDFDTEFTKISADPTSSYFTVYMNGLQPERFYKLIVKTTVEGTTRVIDEDNIFKVVR